MTFYELESQLLSLSSTDKLRVIQLLKQSLANTWKGIERTADICGGDARIAGTRIPVWVLVESKTVGYSDDDLLASYPALNATDLSNAWAYAEAFSEEIEQTIKCNEAA